MAATSYHTRSNSFPDRPHPLNVELDEQLRRLKSSETASTSSSSICHQLNGLQDLHDCTDKFLLLPLTQQSLAQGHHEKLVDELLDGSLRLLDMCDIAKDALLQTKESSQELLSFMRRRCGGETGKLSSEARKYLTSRKAVKKAIRQGDVLRKLKVGENSTSKRNQESGELVKQLEEVEAITISSLECLLSIISSSKAPTKLSGWTLVSKLVKPKTKRIACEEEEEKNEGEFQKVDTAIYNLISSKKDYNIKYVENVQNQLKDLEFCIQDLEGKLESLYRRLIKTRVSLLNIVNH
ncbi:uncharacterized protein LOC119991430 [Tripterygium wilfordii]|nr:uncharacterized protein LOC119991430 [Tripterygium wilfordii]